MSGGGAGGVKERPRPHAEARTSDPDFKKRKCLVFLHPEGHDPRNHTFSFFVSAMISLFGMQLFHCLWLSCISKITLTCGFSCHWSDLYNTVCSPDHQ